MRRHILRILASTAFVLALASCGGGSDTSSSSSDPSLSGVAAIGAPVSGGTVTVRCATGPTLTATTRADGSWSAVLDGQTFPCMVSVTGGNVPAGQTLHSLALGTGHLNVTPLTTLVLAAALGVDPDDLTTLPSLEEARAALEQGITKVAAFLEASGYSGVPSDPFTQSFVPTAGDAYDDLLEQIARSLDDAGISVGELIETVASGNDNVPLPLTHVFSASELAAMPQLNKASLAASGDTLTMSLQEGDNPVGAFVGGGKGNKAVLQLPGLAGTKLADFKSMSMDVKGPTTAGGKNIYAYVNLTVDLQCDGTPLPANATLEQVRAKRRILIYDPYVHYVQHGTPPLNDSAFTTMNFDFITPGWRISAGIPVGGVAVNPNYHGDETLESFDFATYPNACIVDGITGDAGVFRDKTVDGCDTGAALDSTKPATCGKPYSGVTVILGDSNTIAAASWQVKNIRFEAKTVRNFRFQ